MSRAQEIGNGLVDTTAPIKTWDSRVEVHNPADTMARLRKAGFPLSDGPVDADDAEGASASNIVALIAVTETSLAALVATPSGLVYRFEPDAVDEEWWSFAARNYYVVTGNLVDRKRLAELSKVDAQVITGRSSSRRKETELSGWSLDDLLGRMAPGPAGQETLFSV